MRLFLKIIAWTDRKAGGSFRTRADRELVAGTLFDGLPVCAGFELPAGEIAAIRDRFGLDRRSRIVAFEFIESDPLAKLLARWPIPRRIAAWCYVAEVLEAIRCRGILYADVKPENVLFDKRLGTLRLIDFEAMVPWQDSRTYMLWLNYTPEYAPPESHRGGPRDESTVVYELGMMLGWFVDPGFCNSARLESGRIERVVKRLARHAHPQLAELFARATSVSPHRRPRGFDDVVDRLYAIPIGRALADQWRRFRAPFDVALRAHELVHPALA